MGFFFNLILIAIFVYVVYRVLVTRNTKDKDPYQNNDAKTTDNDVKDDTSIQKKIDMSNVEDADYKDVD